MSHPDPMYDISDDQLESDPSGIESDPIVERYYDLLDAAESAAYQQELDEQYIAEMEASFLEDRYKSFVEIHERSYIITKWWEDLYKKSPMDWLPAFYQDRVINCLWGAAQTATIPELMEEFDFLHTIATEISLGELENV